MIITKQFNMTDGGYARSEQDWINPTARDVADEVAELIEQYINSIPINANTDTELTLSINMAYKQTPQEV